MSAMNTMNRTSNRSFVRMMLLLLLTALLLTALSLTAHASAKSKAMKAYKKMLSKKYVVVIPRGTTMDYWSSSGRKYTSSKASTLQFAIGYVNNDKVPELFVRTKSNIPYGKRCCAVFTCKGKKVYRLYAGDSYCFLTGYYKKKGCFCTYESTDGTPYYRGLFQQNKTSAFPAAKILRDPDPEEGYTSYSVNGADCSRAVYLRKVASLTKNAKVNKLSWNNNTASKRRKKLK